MLQDAEKAINYGDNIIIYPQGTRVKPGENKPYLPGVYALYNHLKIPVVPIALNSGKFWYKFNLSGPGMIKVLLLNEILPGLKKREFMNATKIQGVTVTRYRSAVQRKRKRSLDRAR